MAKKTDVIKEVQDTEVLRVDLTEDQVSKAAKAMAQKHGELIQLDKDLKAFKATIKGKTELCAAEINLAARLVRDTYDMLEVAVTRESNYTKGTVRIVRQDTGEIVTRRKMTADEKQQEMDFDKAGNDADADD